MIHRFRNKQLFDSDTTAAKMPKQTYVFLMVGPTCGRCFGCVASMPSGARRPLHDNPLSKSCMMMSFHLRFSFPFVSSLARKQWGSMLRPTVIYMIINLFIHISFSLHAMFVPL